MYVVFKTESGKEFNLAVCEKMDDALKEVSTAILVAYKMGDPIASIYNDFMTMPVSKQALPLDWKFENCEYTVEA